MSAPLHLGARTHGELKDRALAMRLDYDLSVRTISQRLGVPRSTVGGWVRGHGETREWRDCKLCKETFTFASSKKVFCSRNCGQKYGRTFLGWAAS